MASYNLFLLPGDGIGPEVMKEVEAIIAWFNAEGIASFAVDRGLVGGCAYDAHGQAISEADMAKAMAPTPCCSAPSAARSGTRCPTRCAPRRACCACARTWACSPTCARRSAIPALADASSLKREVVEGLDILIVRELTGGVYFGEPKTITDLGNGQKRGIDTQVYETYEIERIARVAFELAKTRRNKVASAEKRNVMKTGVLWNEVVTRVHAAEYPDVAARARAGRQLRHAARPLAEAV